MNKLIVGFLVTSLLVGGGLLTGCGQSRTAKALEQKEQAKQLMKTGNWGQVNTLLQNSVANNPKDPEAEFLLGISFYNLHNYPAALAHLESDLKLDPGNMQARLMMGNVYRDMQQYDKAEAAYRDLMGRAPDYAQAYLNLARMLKENKRPKDALAVLEQGSARVQGPDVWLELGQEYQNAKLPDKARAAYQNALKVDPNNQQAKVALDYLK